MKVSVQGKGTVILSENDTVGSPGGEGAVFSKGGLAFKIYHDPDKMIPTGKIKELQPLSKNPLILAPIDILLSTKKGHKPVGFTMNLASGTNPLASAFSNSFFTRNNFNSQKVTNLIEQMTKTISFIHDNDCLIVDGNEFNYLLSDDLLKVFFIDVDSYKTKSYSATAIMPSIRDYTTNTFSENTDWFGLGIIACQFFVGIHPFKGKHPNFAKNDFEGRIKANVSIFGKDVTVPSAARDFSCIPGEYKDWFVKMFEDGERLPPPSVIGPIVFKPVKVKVVSKTSDNFNITKMEEYDENVLSWKSVLGIPFAQLETKIVLNKITTVPISTPNVVLATNNMFIAFESVKGQLFAGEGITVSPTAVNNMFVMNNTLYVVNNEKIIQMEVSVIGNKIIVSPAKSWRILYKASQVLNGVIYTNIFGSSFLTIPYAINVCQTVRIEELDNHRIIDAKYEKGVCVINTLNLNTNKYERMTIVFKDKQHTTYTLTIEDDIDPIDVNFTVLDNGIVILIDHLDQVLVFHKKDQHKVKLIKDSAIKGDVKLTSVDNSVRVISKNIIYKLEMK